MEIIGATGGASRRPYGNWVVYVAFAVMVGMKMLVVVIPLFCRQSGKIFLCISYFFALSPVIKPSSSAEQISPPIIFPSQTIRFIIILSSVFPLSSV